MSDSPAHIFKTAAEENNEEKRIRKIIRGCKLLSEIMPFDDILYQMKGTKDWLQYLIICSIFSRKSIDMIVSTLLQKFKDDLGFMKIALENILFVFSISEEEHEVNRNNIESDERINFLIILGVQFEPVEISQFSKAVQEKVTSVKINALNYCELVVSSILKLLVEGDFETFGKILHSFLVCLISTKSDEVITRVCMSIEGLKKTHSRFFRNGTEFDSMVETVLLSKRPGFFKTIKSKRGNEESEHSPNESVEEAPPEIKSPERSPTKKSIKKELNDSFSEIREDIEKELMEFIQTPAAGETGKDEEAYDVISRDNMMREFESWLCEKTDGSHSFDEKILEAFKKRDNIEFFLTLVTDPFSLPIDPKWVRKHMSVASQPLVLDQSIFKESDLKVISKCFSEDKKFTPFYYHRSFRAASVIAEKKNLKFLTNLNEDTYETIVSKLTSEMGSPDNKFMNLYHVGIILDAVIAFDSNVIAEFMLNMNTIPVLLINVNNPQIQEILLNLLEPVTSKYKITQSTQVAIWRYLFFSKFYYVLSNFIVKGEKENDKILESRMRCKKQHLLMDNFSQGNVFSFEKPVIYKRSGSIQSKEFSLENLLGRLAQQNPSSKQQEYLWVEELTGEKKDIDGFRKFIAQARKLERERNADDKQERKKEGPEGAEGKKGNKKLTSFLSENSLLKKGVIPNEIPEVLVKENPRASLLLFEKRGAQTKEKLALLKLKVVFNLKKKDFLAEEDDLAHPDTEDLKSGRPVREKTGFSATEIKSLYPSSFYKEREGYYDVLARQKCFSSENVIANEIHSLPASELILSIVSSALENDSNTEFKKLLAIPIKYTEPGLDLLFDYECFFIEQLFKNYLVKIRPLFKLRELCNSAYNCGCAINKILRNMKTHPVISQYRFKLKRITNVGFEYLCKILLASYERTRHSIKIQKASIPNPLGSTRLLMVETLHLIVSGDEDDQYRIIYRINQTLWHALFNWFCLHRNNNQYQRLFVELFFIALDYGDESLVYKLLFQLNIISCLSNGLEELVKNDVPIKNYNIDLFLMNLKLIVDKVDHATKTRASLATVRNQILLSNCWLHLRKYVVLSTSLKKDPMALLNSEFGKELKSPTSKSGGFNLQDQLIASYQSKNGKKTVKNHNRNKSIVSNQKSEKTLSTKRSDSKSVVLPEISFNASKSYVMSERMESEQGKSDSPQIYKENIRKVKTLTEQSLGKTTKNEGDRKISFKRKAANFKKGAE